MSQAGLQALWVIRVLGLTLVMLVLLLRAGRAWLPNDLLRLHRDFLLALTRPLPALAFVLLVAASTWIPVVLGGVLVLLLSWLEGRAAAALVPEGQLTSEQWLQRIIQTFPQGRYTDVRPVGEGGMARVFRAKDNRLQRDVAFKLMDTSLVADAEMRARFVREGRAMATLHHEGLPAVHDVADAPFPFMVMSFIEGHTLAEYFEEHGRAPSEKVRDWMTQAAKALHHAHGAGIIHRDVKPENLMLDRQGRIWVIDFGIARMESQAAITRVGVIMGTPLFLSPEQINGDEPDVSNDVYSLAATGYFMLSGEYPYTVASLVQEDGGGPAALPEGVDAQLAACVMLAVSRRPQDRPGDMQALAAMLAG